MDSLFQGWTGGEIALFAFLVVMLTVFLTLGVASGVAAIRGRREERQIASIPQPVLVVLAPPGPPRELTLAHRLMMLGAAFVDRRDLAAPGPALTGAIAVVADDGCGYCEEGTMLRVHEVDQDLAVRLLFACCDCGGFHVRIAPYSRLLEEWYDWYSDPYEMIGELERYGRRVLRETRYRHLFEGRNVIQRDVDAMTNALIRLSVSVR